MVVVVVVRVELIEKSLLMILGFSVCYGYVMVMVVLFVAIMGVIVEMTIIVVILASRNDGMSSNDGNFNHKYKYNIFTLTKRALILIHVNET